MELRPYQADAVAASYEGFRVSTDGVVVEIPTGGGKSLVIAKIATDCVGWDRRVVVLAHRRELLEQTAAKVEEIAPSLGYGVYCAGLGRRDTGEAITFASIQSCCDKADAFGPIDVVMIDEAHLVPDKGEGQYRQFLAEARANNPGMRLLGLTATPYRTDSGPLCTGDGIFKEIVFSISTSELIEQGFLCQLTTKSAAGAIDTSGLHRRAGEFIQAEVDSLVGGADMVRAACGEIVAKTTGRRHVLVFSAGVSHGEHVAGTLRGMGCDVEFVHGDTPRAERDNILGRFVAGDLHYLVNCDLLTTGFDAPNVDCVAVLRPTASPVLWVQMVGRGLRLHRDKTDCLVLDFGQNAVRLGPIDDVNIDKPAKGKQANRGKVCPQCSSVVASGVMVCGDCGYEFASRKRSHEKTASEAPILSTSRRTKHRVRGVEYSVHEKRWAAPNHPKTLKVAYDLDGHGEFAEYICLEHPNGYARRKAERWWSARSNEPAPFTAGEAAWVANSGGLAAPHELTLKHVEGEKFPTVGGVKLGPIPGGVRI